MAPEAPGSNNPGVILYAYGVPRVTQKKRFIFYKITEGHIIMTKKSHFQSKAWVGKRGTQVWKNQRKEAFAKDETHKIERQIKEFNTLSIAKSFDKHLIDRIKLLKRAQAKAWSKRAKGDIQARLEDTWKTLKEFYDIDEC